jgi:hypothetical protein
MYKNMNTNDILEGEEHHSRYLNRLLVRDAGLR